MTTDFKGSDSPPSAGARFSEKCESIKKSALEKLEVFLGNQREDLDITLDRATANADMTDDRVLKFAKVVYLAAGAKVVNELQRGYEEQLNELMDEVERLKTEVIVFTRNLSSAYEEERMLKKLTAGLDVLLVVFCGALSVIAWLYEEPVAIGAVAIGLLLATAGVRIWIERSTSKNLNRMQRDLNQSKLDEIHDRIGKKRRQLGKTLIEYAKQSERDAD